MGGLLESSGWETALNEAAVASLVMLGGLHIEMALWNVGGLLESSGWETALNEAAVASVVMLGGLHIEMASVECGWFIRVIRMGNSS